MPEGTTGQGQGEGQGQGTGSGNAAGNNAGTQQGNAGQNSGGSTGNAAGNNAGTSAAQTARTFTQEDLDRIIDQRLERERQKAEKEKQAATRTVEDRVASLEKELQDERRKGLRVEAASRHGLPSSIAARLQGDTAEEIEKDAKALAEQLKTLNTGQEQGRRRINSDAGSGNQDGNRGHSINDAIRRAAGRT